MVHVDFGLSDEQQLIQRTAREFCDAEIAPFAAEWDRSETIDRGIVAKLAELGFLAAALPEEHGGMGLDMVSYTLVVEEIGRADSNVRGIVSVSNGLYGKTRRPVRHGRAAGTPPPRPRGRPGARLLRADRARRRLRPGQPRDARRARRRRLASSRGQKIFITLGSWASTRARLRPHRRGRAARAHLLRRPDRRGRVRGAPDQGKLGLRAQDTAELFLDGVRVGDDALVGELGGGFKVAMSALDHGRISLGAGCVGIAQGCLDASVAYTKERRQFGRSVASFQLVQELLADIAVETEAARLLVRRAAATADRGERHTVEASYAKYFASEVAVRAANAAVQAHGGYGYVDEYPVGKYLRDARVTTLYEGTSQIQKLLIGRALTGENAFA